MGEFSRCGHEKIYTTSKGYIMKKIFSALTIVIILYITTGYAQEEKPIDVFGFFQAKYTHTAESSLGNSKASFGLQQMNIMMRKDLGQNFSAFINLQMTNSFNTERMWGTMNLEEAWMKYRLSEGFSIQGGLLIPAFNNLNEIKNKTPLLPYIIRPLIYESSFSTIIDNGDFVPEHAFVQVSGTQNLSQVKLDYAVFLGNSEPSYIFTTGALSTSPAGDDTTTFKMVGGRVGIRTGDIKAGISATYDREKAEEEIIPGMILSAGNVPRIRIGGDLSFKIKDFSFEGELITVTFPMNDLTKASLHQLVRMTTIPGTNISPFHAGLDEKFGYVNLMYDINDQWYVYCGGDYLQDDAETFFKDGLTLLTFGGGYRPIDRVVLKGQYLHVGAKNEDFIKFNIKTYNLAVTVLF
jgi:hypothetical protein